jgi:DNA-binding MarR family transcriptional regulator
VTDIKTTVPSQSDYQLLADFRYTLRQFAAFSEQAALSLGLTAQQHQALLAIKGSSNGISLHVGEIAERLLIKPNTAAELVNRLAKLNWVERREDPQDKRRIDVALTPKAETLLEQLSQAHLNELRAMRPLLKRLLARVEHGD